MIAYIRSQLTFVRQVHYAAGGLALYLSWHLYGLGAMALALAYGLVMAAVRELDS